MNQDDYEYLTSLQDLMETAERNLQLAADARRQAAEDLREAGCHFSDVCAIEDAAVEEVSRAQGRLLAEMQAMGVVRTASGFKPVP